MYAKNTYDKHNCIENKKICYRITPVAVAQQQPNTQYLKIIPETNFK